MIKITINIHIKIRYLTYAKNKGFKYECFSPKSMTTTGNPRRMIMPDISSHQKSWPSIMRIATDKNFMS